jgi:hypothetical protein
VKSDPDELPLLGLGEFEERKAIAGMYIVLVISKVKTATHLARHEDDKDTTPDIGVHSLIPRCFEQKLLILHRLGLRTRDLGDPFPLDEGIARPTSTDKPPLASRVGIKKVLQRDSEWL